MESRFLLITAGALSLLGSVQVSASSAHNVHCLYQPSNGEPLWAHQGGSVQVLCQPGFQAKEKTAVCKHGVFEPPPLCVPGKTGPSLLNCLRQPLNGHPLMGHSGDKLSVQCYPGFKARFSPVTCTRKGFQPAPQCLKGASEVKPGLPVISCKATRVTNAVSTMRAMWGTRARLSCRKGFQASARSYECSRGGFHPEPACVPARGLPCHAAPANALPIVAEPGSLAMLFCMPGYVPEQGQYKCKQSGKLEGTPRCIRVPLPSTLYEGGCYAEVDDGKPLMGQLYENVQVVCNKGFHPLRPWQPSLCLPGGLFFPYPKCVPFPDAEEDIPYLTPEFQAALDDSASFKTSTTTTTKSPTPRQPLNCVIEAFEGTSLTLRATHGSYATLECEPRAKVTLHHCLDGVFYPKPTCKACHASASYKSLLFVSPEAVSMRLYLHVRLCAVGGSGAEPCQPLLSAGPNGRMEIGAHAQEILVSKLQHGLLCSGGADAKRMEYALVRSANEAPTRFQPLTESRLQCRQPGEKVHHNRRRFVAPIQATWPTNPPFQFWVQSICP